MYPCGGPVHDGDDRGDGIGSVHVRLRPRMMHRHRCHRLYHRHHRQDHHRDTPLRLRLSAVVALFDIMHDR